MIAHVTTYERWLLDAMLAAGRREQPAPSTLDGGDIDARNQVAHEQTAALSLAAVQAEARDVWAQLLPAVERVPEAELLDLDQAPDFVMKGWGRDTRLWEAIAGLTTEHYEEHLPDFAAWAPAAARREV